MPHLPATVLIGMTVAAFAGGQPHEVQGNRLGSNTGLRLVVANKPPFVLDVDSGRVTRLEAVGSALDAVGVSSDAAVVVAEPGSPVSNKHLWIVRSAATTASPIGSTAGTSRLRRTEQGSGSRGW